MNEWEANGYTPDDFEFDPTYSRVIGYEQDYPGSYKWPILEILCPECNKWCRDYGEVSTEIDGKDRPLCIACGDKVDFPETVPEEV